MKKPLELSSVSEEDVLSVVEYLENHSQYFKSALLKALWKFYVERRGNK